MKKPASDGLGGRDPKTGHCDPDLAEWCDLALELWKENASLHGEFLDCVEFLDFTVEEAERLIRSASLP